jgi:hypothetical protein
MSWQILLILGVAVLFYGALPAVGAFVVRGQWRRFRKTVDAVSRLPTAGSGSVARDRPGAAGRFRFFGTLEAIQGEDRIWITNGRLSVAADLRGVRVYLVPELDDGTEAGGGSGSAELGSVPWHRIFSLPEGTPVFVGGQLYSEEGRAVFRDDRSHRLLVVIHDCPREAVLLRAISGGRHRNEYMNVFTLPSVGVGALTLILLAFTLFASSARLPGLLALTAGLAPMSPFLPPSFPLYFAYRRSWKKARQMRVQRDLARLLLRYFPPSPGDGQRDRRATLLRADGSAIVVTGGDRIPLPPGLRRIAVDLPPRSARRALSPEGSCVVTAGYTEDAEGVRLRDAEDPMAGSLLVQGDPQAVAHESARAALFYEAVSGILIGLTVAVNLPLVFLLLSRLIR